MDETMLPQMSSASGDSQSDEQGDQVTLGTADESMQTQVSLSVPSMPPASLPSFPPVTSAPAASQPSFPTNPPPVYSTQPPMMGGLPGRVPTSPPAPPAPAEPSFPGTIPEPIATPAPSVFHIVYDEDPSPTPGGFRAMTSATLRALRVPPLAKPFPRRFTIVVGIGAFAAVLLSAILEGALLHGDWAQAALAAAVVGLGLAAFTIAVAAVRFTLGRRGPQFFTLSGALAVALVLISVGGLVGQHGIHVAQARYSEQHGQWAEAITEWELAGEHSPDATDVARDYITWGNQLVTQGSYAAAANRFDTAQAAAPADATLMAQAQNSLYQMYKQWVSSPTSDLPYGDAVATFSAQRTDATCDGACHTEASALEAQARVTFGQQLIAAKHFGDAVVQLEAVGTQLASTSYVAQAHTLAATANLDEGQDLRTSRATCGQAVPIYQHLKDQYADTPEGAQAAKDLVAPVAVSGSLTGYPSSPVPHVHLSHFSIPSQDIYSDDYNVTLDASGAYSFTGVRQGTYTFSTSRDLGYKVEFRVFSFNVSTGTKSATLQVGPLCPVVLGATPYNSN